MAKTFTNNFNHILCHYPQIPERRSFVQYSYASEEKLCSVFTCIKATNYPALTPICPSGIYQMQALIHFSTVIVPCDGHFNLDERFLNRHEEFFAAGLDNLSPSTTREVSLSLSVSAGLTAARLTSRPPNTP